MRLRCLLWMVLVAIILVTAGDAVSDATTARAVGPAEFEFYTVRPRETWNMIAVRFGVPLADLWAVNGVTNPARLAAGQRLLIPDSMASPASLITQATIISRRNPLLPVAVRSGYPLSAILMLNGLERPEEAYSQRVLIPQPRSLAVVVPPPPPTPTQPAAQNPTAVPGPALISSRMGIQGYFAMDPAKMDTWLTRAQDAGFTWVKFQVNWKITEDPPDQYPLMGTLDAFMNNVQRHHLNVLFSVVKAPDWARTTNELDGPPKHYADYTNFVQLLANRYKGRLDQTNIAFEIWNEPNTKREWNGAPLSAADYVNLLGGAYVAIKGEDQRYTVVSAGLSPTGVNDGDTAIDDREFLRQMYQAGLARVTDAIGIHPYGWANPPRLRCCNDPSGPPAYNDDPRFFFLNTIEDYRAIQAEYGDADRHDLWATEFGWGTMEGIGAPIPDESPWFAFVTPDQQAKYIRNAFLAMQDKDYMGPMFLWNLNMSTLVNFDPDHAAYSIFLPPDIPRPAYQLLKSTPKITGP